MEVGGWAVLACMVVDTAVEQVACMVEELVGVLVLHAAVVAMLARAESPLEKSALLVGSVAAVEDLARVPCLT